MLEELSRDEDPWVAAQAALHPNTSESLLFEMSRSMSHEALWGIAQNQRTPSALLHSMARDAAQNPRRSKDHLFPNIVLAPIAHHPNAMNETLELLVGFDEAVVDWALVKNPNSTCKTISVIAQRNTGRLKDRAVQLLKEKRC